MANDNMDHTKNYRKLLLMTILSFLSMYILMYSMVNSFNNVYNSLNQIYMAGLMTAPMTILELILMNRMYPNKNKNNLILVGSLLLLVAFFTFTRWQSAITDRQFLRSMIPHHAGAVLMCEQAPLKNAKVVELCKNIIASQKKEIDEMKSILHELN
jgi:uncharacterized protein (DUF305 family)